MKTVIKIWKGSLQNLLNYYEAYRARIDHFFPQLYLFFIFINITCYWLATATAFPEILAGDDWFYYFKIQFPVGILGALFDSLSFFVTLYIVRSALRTTSAISYISHLSIDFVIAMAATAWVLFVFLVSGWLISFTESNPQLLSERAETYERIVVSAVENPSRNVRNIYFGIIMGVSAMIPTGIHLYMSLNAIVRSLRK